MIYLAQHKPLRGSWRKKPFSPSSLVSRTKQGGAAILSISVIILFLITFVTLYANRGAILEQKMSANQYNHSGSFEAAQGGIDYTMAWLATGGNASSIAWNAVAGTTGAAWTSNTSYPPYNQRNTTSLPAQTIGKFLVTTTLWRSTTSPKVVEINAISTGDATATVKQIINLVTLKFKVPTIAPLVVNGPISGITGNPNIVGTNSIGQAVVSSAPLSSIDMGHMKDENGNPVAVTPIGFSGTSWDYVFDISKSDMAQIAKTQPGGATAGPIYYYNDATIGSYSPSTIGSLSQPVILVFDIQTTTDCPKINGGQTIVGIVYCGKGFDMNGWGGTKIFGSLIIDTPLTQFTANTELYVNSGNNISPYTASTSAIVTKVTGSWRDF